MRGPVNEWTFRLILADLDIDDDAQLDALYEAGCDDATFATDEHGAYAVFHRQAPAPEKAVLSAIRAIESICGRVRVKVETEDDWLTAAEIAERTGRSRQNISQLIRGERGPGGFPVPAVRRDARNPLWSWEDVWAWFARYAPGDVPTRPERPSPDFVAAVNDRLDLRERHRRIPHASWWPDIAEALPLVS
jgi:hypothetical protein